MDDAFVQQFVAQLYPIIGTILLALLSWGSAEFISFIRKKTKNERLAEALTSISTESISAVNEVEQTLRRALSDGKLDENEKKQLKSVAVRKVKERMIPMVMKVAQKNLNDVDDYISGKVEEAVLKNKQINK